MSLKNYLVLIKKCTFNKKLLIILKGYVHSLRHRFINQKKWKDGSSYFYKNQKYRRLGKEKKKFSYFISEIPNFSYMGFFRKCSMFRQIIPLTLNLFHNFF